MTHLFDRANTEANHSKILLQIAAAGGIYKNLQPTYSVEDHSKEDCAWYFEQIKKFIGSRSHSIDLAVEFFEGIITSLKTATWNYIAKEVGKDFVSDLKEMLKQIAGDRAPTAFGF